MGSVLKKSDKFVAFFYSVKYLMQRFALLTNTTTKWFTAVGDNFFFEDNALVRIRRQLIYATRLMVYKRNRLSFGVLDRNLLSFVSNINNTHNFLRFNTFFFIKLRANFLINSSISDSNKFVTFMKDRPSYQLIGQSKVAFFDVFLKLNLFTILFFEFRLGGNLFNFFFKVLSGLLVDFFSIFLYSYTLDNSGKKFFFEFVSGVTKKLIVFFGILQLTPLNTIKVIVNFVLSSAEKIKFFHFFKKRGVDLVSSRLALFSTKLCGYSRGALFDENSFFDVAGLLRTTVLPLDTFLSAYVKIKKRKKHLRSTVLKIKRKYKPWLRFKRKKFKRKTLTGYPIKVF